jgi:hypothetical protein
MIEQPGVYDLPRDEYHADPCPEPSLSASLAHTLLTRSPLHAWQEHPRLNPPTEPEEPTREQDEGTALHALILENRSAVAVLDFPDYRTKAAQDARKNARLADEVPILAARWAELADMATTMRSRLIGHEAEDAFTAGRPERTMVWVERVAGRDVWCRALGDWMQDDTAGWLDDLKTVGGGERTSAAPAAFARSMVSAGHALQAAWYLRGARALGRTPRGFRFVVIEREAPHGLSVVSPGPEMLALGERLAASALDQWAQCLARDEWPAYPRTICWAEPRQWDVAEAQEREEMRAFQRKAEAGAQLQRRMMAKIGSPAR